MLIPSFNPGLWAVDIEIDAHRYAPFFQEGLVNLQIHTYQVPCGANGRRSSKFSADTNLTSVERTVTIPTGIRALQRRANSSHNTADFVDRAAPTV